MADRKNRNIREMYERAFGNGVSAENRGRRYEAWANEKKQEQEEKAEGRRRKRPGTSGGHNF